MCAGLVVRVAIVYVGVEGAERDGGGHGSTLSAMQCRESLPFRVENLCC